MRLKPKPIQIAALIRGHGSPVNAPWAQAWRKYDARITRGHISLRRLVRARIRH